MMHEEPTSAAAVARILAAHRAADPETKARGRTWYAEASALARELAADGPRGFGIVRAAAVIAVLSANQSWQANVQSARAAVAAAVAGEDVAAACRTLRDSSRKAAAILAGENPSDVVSGPKVSVFWRAIAGDPAAITVDRWAARAAGFPDSGLTGRRHERITAAYRTAAIIAGESPRDLQAIAWIVERGSHA